MTDEDAPMLGLATTEELLCELAVRMEVTQNSIKGRELGVLCREALDNFGAGVLEYRPAGPFLYTRDPEEDRLATLLQDPDVWYMVHNNHTPEETWNYSAGGGTLASVHCSMCHNQWPCPPVVEMRKVR